MLALFISFFLLLITPLVYRWLSSTPRLKFWSDIAIAIAMIWVLTVHVMAESFANIGYYAVALALVGFVGMVALELYSHRHHNSLRGKALIIIFIGCMIHVAMDGYAIFISDHENFLLFDHHALEHSHHHAHAHDHHSGPISSLALAVLLHRLPVALLIWSKLSPMIGATKAYLFLILMGIVAVLGFLLGGVSLGEFDLLKHLSYFEAFIAGCLYHVVIHHLHHVRHLAQKILFSNSRRQKPL